ncbi:MAG: DUF6456 domain-containing protein [Pseudomonadota bacterium]
METLPAVPAWVPSAARNYLAHTEGGQSIRDLARAAGCHASTVLRQIRRVEARRDDILVDEALHLIGPAARSARTRGRLEETPDMSISGTEGAVLPDDTQLEADAARVLARLNESGAVLAVARDMEKAVVVLELPDGRSVRTAVVDRGIAQAMALKDWITIVTEGRITRYRITPAGKSELQDRADRAAEAEAEAGFAEAAADFHRATEDTEDRPRSRRVRYGLAESPVVVLARRREKDGTPFLDEAQVRAGERLREDYELAAAGPEGARNWEGLLTAEAPAPQDADLHAAGPAGASARVFAALRDLGPGLADIALRCCCHLEGLEVTEKRMGWSARSGKIVLRIALERLRRHYDETYRGGAPLIG